MVSHQTVVIRLQTRMRQTVRDIVTGYLVLHFVESIVAPSQFWSPCQLRVEETPDEDVVMLRDENSGLRVRGSVMYAGPRDLGREKGWYM